jgi:hypothetical protein
MLPLEYHLFLNFMLKVTEYFLIVLLLAYYSCTGCTLWYVHKILQNILIRFTPSIFSLYHCSSWDHRVFTLLCLNFCHTAYLWCTYLHCDMLTRAAHCYPVKHCGVFHATMVKQNTVYTLFYCPFFLSVIINNATVNIIF